MLCASQQHPNVLMFDDSKGMIGSQWQPSRERCVPRGGLVGLAGDHSWQMIVCMRGEVWITQECDVQDYLLRAGGVFIITRPGRVVIQALRDSRIQVTEPVRSAPYSGRLVRFK
jgi:hypothetical protein